MKLPFSSPAFLLLALTGAVMADLPKKAPLSRYSALWTNSPFTSKPPPPDPGAAVNLLDDYALIGVSPIGGTNYRVTLIHKKKPDERITVDSDKTSTDGFKILEVVRKSGDPLGTTVRMTSGTTTGVVAFDSNLLTLAAPPKAAPVPQAQPGHPPVPGQPPVDPNQAVRQPRPRVVPLPPALPGAPGQPNIPGAQARPNLPATPPTTQQQRPTRRGN